MTEKNSARIITNILESKFYTDQEDPLIEGSEDIQENKTINQTNEFQNNFPTNSSRNLKYLRSNLRTSLKDILEKYTINTKDINTLDNIFLKSHKIQWGTENKDHKFNRIYKLVSSPAILILAFSNISNNKGIATPGTKKNTIDGYNLKKILDISKSLKEKKFSFTPFLRRMIPKPLKPGQSGPPKLRPLGIMNFEDKIVQESIRIILNAIYEPSFSKYSCNFGFRPKIGCQNAMIAIKKRSRGTYFAIEGDIKGAYDNVNFDKLIDILKQSIDDQDFIKLIKDGLNCGCMCHGNLETTLTGVPQGSIVSPLFFNIYMHEFDKYITNKIYQLETNQANLSKHDKLYDYNREYRDSKNQLTMLTRRINKIRKGKKVIGHYLKGGYKPRNISTYISHRISSDTKSNLGSSIYRTKRLNQEITYRNRNIRTYKKIAKSLNNLRRTTQVSDPRNKDLIIRYFRYADDWIILNNRGNDFNKTLMKDIGDWLKDHLYLELSLEKTKITDFTKHPVNFLGYNIFIKHVKQSRITRKNKTYVARTGSTEISFGIDDERLSNRLITKGYCDKSLFPINRTSLSTLDPELIIESYNSVIRGLIAYYAPIIDNKGYMNKYSYILAYSCMKTFAQKYHSTIHKLFGMKNSRFGYPPQVTITRIKGKKEITKTFSLLYNESFRHYYEKMVTTAGSRLDKPLGSNLETIIANQNNDLDNPFKILIKNYHTGMLLFLEQCAICGSKDEINIHHVKHVRKMGTKSSGFTQLLSKINRKKIVVCRECHNRIHNGTYDGISLADLALPQNINF